MKSLTKKLISGTILFVLLGGSIIAGRYYLNKEHCIKKIVDFYQVEPIIAKKMCETPCRARKILGTMEGDYKYLFDWNETYQEAIDQCRKEEE